MVPASDRAGDDRAASASTGFWSAVSQVLGRLGQVLPFALFPLLTALLDTERVRRALDPAPGGWTINVEFAFPSPLVDLWRLATPPEPRAAPAGTYGPSKTDVMVDAPVPVDLVGSESAGLVGTVGVMGGLLLYAALFAAIQAIYVGGLDRRLRGKPIAPVGLVVRYAPRFFVFGLVVFGATLAMIPVALIGPGLLLLAIPVVLVFGYLFYATPFLFVVEDADVVEAFRRSYGYAVDGEAYFWFALWHLAVTALASLGLSVLINDGPGGFLLALGIASAFSFVLTAATVAFLQDLGPRPSSGRRAPVTR